MTSSDAPPVLDRRTPSTSTPAAAAPSRRELLARMRRDQNGSPPVAADAPVDDASTSSATRSAPLNRTRILDATEACLREFGYDGTTIRRIAGRLDCAVGTLYRHFKDKRALLDGVTQRRFEPVAERVEQGDDLNQTAALYLQTASAEPQQYRLMFWLASVGDHDTPGVPEVVQRILEGWAHQLGDIDRARRNWAQLHGALMLGIEINPEHLNTEASNPSLPPHNGARADRLTREDITLL